MHCPSPSTELDDERPVDTALADYVVLVVERIGIKQWGSVVAAMALFALGCGPGSASSESMRVGRSVYADRCSACHGSTGDGGVGPSLDDVLETWPRCDDQQDWISLGSERWKTERGPVYGATDTEITKVMPGFATTLTPGEIAAVAAFERVQYGDGDEATELAACGLPTE